MKALATAVAAAGVVLCGCSRDEETSGEREAELIAKAITSTNAAMSQIEDAANTVHKIDSTEERRILANRQRAKEIAKRREERRAKYERTEEERAKREAMNPQRERLRLSKRKIRQEEKRKRREEALRAEEQRRNGKSVSNAAPENSVPESGDSAAPPPESETPEQARIRRANERKELQRSAHEARREYEASLTEEQLATYKRKSIGYWIALETEKKRMREKHDAKREGRKISEDKQNTTNQQKKE